MQLQPKSKTIIDAERDFSGFLAELRAGVWPARRARIRHEAVTCDDLMHYSPECCDFSRLRPLVHEVLTLTN